MPKLVPSPPRLADTPPPSCVSFVDLILPALFLASIHIRFHIPNITAGLGRIAAGPILFHGRFLIPQSAT